MSQLEQSEQDRVCNGWSLLDNIVTEALEDNVLVRRETYFLGADTGETVATARDTWTRIKRAFMPELCVTKETFR
jgi:hypothetical protein